MVSSDKKTIQASVAPESQQLDGMEANSAPFATRLPDSVKASPWGGITKKNRAIKNSTNQSSSPVLEPVEPEIAPNKAQPTGSEGKNMTSAPLSALSDEEQQWMDRLARTDRLMNSVMNGPSPSENVIAPPKSEPVVKNTAAAKEQVEDGVPKIRKKKTELDKALDDLKAEELAGKKPAAQKNAKRKKASPDGGDKGAYSGNDVNIEIEVVEVKPAPVVDKFKSTSPAVMLRSPTDALGIIEKVTGLESKPVVDGRKTNTAAPHGPILLYEDPDWAATDVVPRPDLDLEKIQKIADALGITKQSTETAPEPVLVDEEPDLDIAIAPKLAPVVETKPAPVVETKSAPVVETKSAPVVETKPAPVVETKPHRAVKAEAKPVVVYTKPEKISPAVMLTPSAETLKNITEVTGIEAVTEIIKRPKRAASVDTNPDPLVEPSKLEIAKKPKRVAVAVNPDPVVEPPKLEVAKKPKRAAVAAKPDPVAEPLKLETQKKPKRSAVVTGQAVSADEQSKTVTIVAVVPEVIPDSDDVVTVKVSPLSKVTKLCRVEKESKKREQKLQIDLPPAVKDPVITKVAEVDRAKAEIPSAFPKRVKKSSPLSRERPVRKGRVGAVAKPKTIPPAKIKQSVELEQDFELGELEEFAELPVESRVAKKVRPKKVRSRKVVSAPKQDTGQGAPHEIGFYLYSGIDFLRRMSSSAIQKYLSTVSIDGGIRYKYYRDRGDHFVQSGQNKRAARYFEWALKESPGQEEIFGRLGLCYLKTNRLDDGVRYLERAEQSAVTIYGLDEQLAMAYIRQGENSKAVVRLEAALLESPENFNLNFRLALALDNLGEYNRAVQSFENALKIHPGSTKVYRSMGFSLEQSGQRDRAIQCFKRAAELEE
jgi:tetratricopeptide (TPR) repeat protein